MTVNDTTYFLNPPVILNDGNKYLNYYHFLHMNLTPRFRNYSDEEIKKVLENKKEK